MRDRFAAFVAAYPVVVWTVLGLAAGAVVRYVPGLAGLDVGAVAEVLAGVVTVVTGVVIHTRVSPVPAEDRGL